MQRIYQNNKHNGKNAINDVLRKLLIQKYRMYLRKFIHSQTFKFCFNFAFDKLNYFLFSIQFFSFFLYFLLSVFGSPDLDNGSYCTICS